MLVRLDGKVVTSLLDAYCNERLLKPKERQKAIEFLRLLALGRQRFRPCTKLVTALPRDWL